MDSFDTLLNALLTLCLPVLLFAGVLWSCGNDRKDGQP